MLLLYVFNYVPKNAELYLLVVAHCIVVIFATSNRLQKGCTQVLSLQVFGPVSGQFRDCAAVLKSTMRAYVEPMSCQLLVFKGPHRPTPSPPSDIALGSNCLTA